MYTKTCKKLQINQVIAVINYYKVYYYSFLKFLLSFLLVLCGLLNNLKYFKTCWIPIQTSKFGNITETLVKPMENKTYYCKICGILSVY